MQNLKLAQIFPKVAKEVFILIDTLILIDSLLLIDTLVLYLSL